MLPPDEMDGPEAFGKAANGRGGAIRARHVIDLQWFALGLSVVFGQCERWGYGPVLETGVPGVFFGPVVVGLFWSSLAFPGAVFALLRRERPRERWAWTAAPLSLVMTGVQILAIWPLFE